MNATIARERVASTRRAAIAGIRSFYSRPLGWMALVITSIFLAYGGGGAMFWFHAIYRGEAGPPISDWWHWFFDSSLGFIALTPALFLILPAALWALDQMKVASRKLKAVTYVLLVGVLFGVATGPGPLFHDTLVGRTAPLGRAAVRIFGFDPSVAARTAGAHPHSVVTEGFLQVV
ncbi:MAG: hypothetical protein L0221_15670, partial [Chloroflexi bacterium]|nr:hypothetical protein [Chloroflexota bacterium]